MLKSRVKMGYFWDGQRFSEHDFSSLNTFSCCFNKFTHAAESLAVQSAGLAAGVAAGCPAAFLLSWTLTIMVAVLSTHGSSLGLSASTSLHCVWCNALMSTSIVAAFLIIGAVTVIRAKLCTQPWAPTPARTHSWLGESRRDTDSSTVKDTAFVVCRTVFITRTPLMWWDNIKATWAVAWFGESHC